MQAFADLDHEGEAQEESTWKPWLVTLELTFNPFDTPARGRRLYLQHTSGHSSDGYKVSYVVVAFGAILSLVVEGRNGVEIVVKEKFLGKFSELVGRCAWKRGGAIM